MGAKAWASPVQPRRSSRCGQSVGSDTKLSRCDHATLEWSCSRRGSERGEARARGVGARDGDRGRRHDLGAGHLGVLEAVEREDRLERGLAVVGEHVGVGGLRGAERRGVDRPVGLKHLGVADLHAVARRSADHEAEPAGDVLADVDERVALAGLDRRRPLADRAHAAGDAGLDDRRCRRRSPAPPPNRSRRSRGRPSRWARRGDRSPRRRRGSRADAAGRRRPLGRGRHSHVRAVGALDVELGVRRKLRAECSVPSSQPRRPRYQPSPSIAPMRVLAGVQQLGDIPRPEHDPILVRRPSGREMLVGRLPAVDAEVADAPERGAEAGAHGIGREREARAEQHRRAFDRLRSADRAGLEVGRIDGCLDDELRAPRRPAGRRGDADGVASLLTGFERRAGGCDADRVVGGDGVGDAGVGAVPAHLVAELRGWRRGAPGEAQAGARHSEQLVGVLGAQRDDPGVGVGRPSGRGVARTSVSFRGGAGVAGGSRGLCSSRSRSERADTGQGVGSAGAGRVDPRTSSVGSTEKWVGSVRPWIRSRSRRIARSPMASPAWSTVVREMAG